MKEEFENFDEVIKYIIDKRCVNCGERLALGFFELGFYRHDGGWYVKSINEKLWIYAVCLHCGYQNALWKLR